MHRTRTKSLILISARELASNSATPMFVIDSQGVLVYFNEAAELVLGETFSDSGPLPMEEWGTMWKPESVNGGDMKLGELPLAVALREQRPAHTPIVITGSDGVKRTIAITAFPLFAKVGELAGAMAIFWEAPES